MCFDCTFSQSAIIAHLRQMCFDCTFNTNHVYCTFVFNARVKYLDVRCVKSTASYKSATSVRCQTAYCG